MVKLLDAFVRHQIYLEGYKSGLDGSLDPILRDMYDDLAVLLTKTKVEKLNELTKTALSKLIRSINKLQLRRNDAFRARMLTELQKFTQLERNNHIRIMETVEEKPYTEASEDSTNKLVPLLWLGASAAASRKLWAHTKNQISPATGQTANQMLTGFSGYTRAQVQRTVRRGVANGWTVKQTLTEIFGKGGVIPKSENLGKNMISAVVQHVSNVVQSAVASVFYNTYEWVSILDNRTTKICRTRDGILYVYGTGPLPPAHYGCRSRAIPRGARKSLGKTPNTYSSWLALQPKSVQDDILGRTVAARLRAGTTTDAAVTKFINRRKLTSSAFADKMNMILAA